MVVKVKGKGDTFAIIKCPYCKKVIWVECKKEK